MSLLILPACFVCLQMAPLSLHLLMILSIRHKGLKLYFEKGDASKLQPQHVNKIRLILTRLEAAKTLGDFKCPGLWFASVNWRVKKLLGD